MNCGTTKVEVVVMRSKQRCASDDPPAYFHLGLLPDLFLPISRRCREHLHAVVQPFVVVGGGTAASGGVR